MQINSIYNYYLTPKQASTLLQKHPKTILRLCKANKLKHIKVGDRYYIDKKQFVLLNQGELLNARG